MTQSDRTYNVLFLCTGNSARSIMAEAALNAAGGARFRAYSAGSFPNGRVNPHALALLSERGLRTEGLRSKSWDEFAKPGAPAMDFIITVCDRAAGEMCPVWPGRPVTAHWGVEDPAAIAGSDADKHRAFLNAFQILNRRIALLVALPPAKLASLAVKQDLDAIGRDTGDGS
jgi:arsenate reductase